MSKLESLGAFAGRLPLALRSLKVDRWRRGAGGALRRQRPLRSPDSSLETSEREKSDRSRASSASLSPRRLSLASLSSARLLNRYEACSEWSLGFFCPRAYLQPSLLGKRFTLTSSVLCCHGYCCVSSLFVARNLGLIVTKKCSSFYRHSFFNVSTD